MFYFFCYDVECVVYIYDEIDVEICFLLIDEIFFLWRGNCDEK